MIITDEMLDQAVKEHEAAGKVIEALRQAKPEMRERILRAASLLLLGEDVCGLSREDYMLLGPGLGRAAQRRR